MKNKMLTIAGAAVLAAGLIFAQTDAAPSPGAPWEHAHGFHHRGGMFGMLGRKLNLTDAQRQQAKSIFSDMRTQAQPVHAQLKQSRAAIFNAVAAGKSADELSQLAQAQAPQLAQLTALRAQAFGKFYAILTPAQQQQLQTMESQWTSHTGGEPASE